MVTNNTNMDQMKQKSINKQKRMHKLPSLPSDIEKENDVLSPVRSSLPPMPSSSTRKSHVSPIPFQPIDDAGTDTTSTGCTTSSQCTINNNDRNVASTSMSFEKISTPMTKLSSTVVSTNDDNVSSDTTTVTSNNINSRFSKECTGVSSLRALSPVSSTTFPTTVIATPSVCGDINTSPESSLGNITTTTDLPQTIELMLQKYPTELLSNDSSKIIKLQQLAVSLTSTFDTAEHGTATTQEATLATTNATKIVHILVTDMLRMHQMLERAECRILELQRSPVPSLCHEDLRSEERNLNEVATHIHLDETIPSLHDGNHDIKETGDANDTENKICHVEHNADDQAKQNYSNEVVPILHARIESLEQEIQKSQTTINQLKSQKQHVIANTKKKKLLLDDMEQRLLKADYELQTVLSERNQLRVSLQEMTDVRDSFKQKLRNQQEIVKDSKQSMMEYKNKLQKTQHMRSLENELLDNFRKLAIHTGFYRWGKPIRLLEVAIATAAADFDETTTTQHGAIHYNSGHTYATTSGDDDDFE